MAEAEDATSLEFDAVKAFVAALKGADEKTKERALRYAAEALGLSRFPPGPPTPSPTVAQPALAAGDDASRSAQPDIKTFISSKNPTTDVQFATATAYFYRFVAAEAQRREVINSKDLAEAARHAGRRQPPDTNATLHNAKAAGYLDNKGGGQFQLTAVGENLVTMSLPGGTTARAKKTTKGKKAKAR